MAERGAILSLRGGNAGRIDHVQARAMVVAGRACPGETVRSAGGCAASHANDDFKVSADSAGAIQRAVGAQAFDGEPCCRPATRAIGAMTDGLFGADRTRALVIEVDQVGRGRSERGRAHDAMCHLLSGLIIGQSSRVIGHFRSDPIRKVTSASVAVLGSSPRFRCALRFKIAEKAAWRSPSEAFGSSTFAQSFASLG